MLKVTIENGESAPNDIFINDLFDLKSVVGTLINEYQKVLAEDEESEKERIIREALQEYDYTSIEEMADRIQQLEDTIEDIYCTVRDVRL